MRRPVYATVDSSCVTFSSRDCLQLLSLDSSSAEVGVMKGGVQK